MIKFSNKNNEFRSATWEAVRDPEILFLWLWNGSDIAPDFNLDFYDFIKRKNLFVFVCFIVSGESWKPEWPIHGVTQNAYVWPWNMETQERNSRRKVRHRSIWKLSKTFSLVRQTFPRWRESFVSIFPTLMSVPAARWPSGSPDRRIMAAADPYCANNNNRYNKLRFS